MNYEPDIILIDRSVEDLPSTRNILDQFKGVDATVIEDVQAIKRPQDFSKAKKMLLITEHKGKPFKFCQGMGPGHVCCNYMILDFISNCPMDRSYCILQSYIQNNPLLTIYTNIDDIIDKAAGYFKNYQGKKFRIGTGELSDSLALDHITGYSKKLIEAFAPFENVSLELKTKTTNISHLLDIKDKGNAVIGWSVNPQEMINSEEIGTASLSERFESAEKALKAGFKIAFHFDPIIYSDGWEEKYKEVAEEIVNRFPKEKLAWISLGTLRFPPQMIDIVMKRFPKSKIFYNELVPVNGKTRYFRPIRENIYKKMVEWLKPISDSVPIYLCMETKPVWNKIMPDIGKSNASIESHICR